MNLRSGIIALSLFVPAPAVMAQMRAVEDQPAPAAVAVVNGTPVTLTDYQLALDDVMDYWRRTAPQALLDPRQERKLRESALEQLLDREILHQEGVRLKIKPRKNEIDAGVAEIKARFARDDGGNPLSDSQAEAAFDRELAKQGLSFKAFRERLARQVLARKVIEQEVKTKVRMPDEEEVRAYFSRLRDFIAAGTTSPPQGMGEAEGQSFMQIAGQLKGLARGTPGMEDFPRFKDELTGALASVIYDKDLSAYLAALKARAVITRDLALAGLDSPLPEPARTSVPADGKKDEAPWWQQDDKPARSKAGASKP